MKKALIIGIDEYDQPLYGCTNDAIAIASLLARHANGAPNFDVKKALNLPTRGALRALVQELFDGTSDIALLYFSGHGYADATGGYLVTPDHRQNDLGMSMDEIICLANNSDDRNKIIILDCCHAGGMGNPAAMGMKFTQLGTGVTILTACRSSESALERGGHGVFTQLLIDALEGGAANVQGQITPGSIYAYIDQALGGWEQRPVFKANISSFTPLRNVAPQVPIEVLRRLNHYFPAARNEFSLDPSFEVTNSLDAVHEVVEPFAREENVAVFNDLQLLQSVGLVVPVGARHMYDAAMASKACRLTPLGRYYWQLSCKERIR